MNPDQPNAIQSRLFDPVTLPVLFATGLLFFVDGTGLFLLSVKSQLDLFMSHAGSGKPGLERPTTCKTRPSV
jgi:hypothetical protein